MVEWLTNISCPSCFWESPLSSLSFRRVSENNALTLYHPHFVFRIMINQRGAKSKGRRQFWFDNLEHSPAACHFGQGVPLPKNAHSQLTGVIK